MKRLSIQYKLLVALIMLPLLTLGTYFLVASQVFRQDKVSYIYDSSANLTRSLSTNVRSEIDNAKSLTANIFNLFNLDDNTWSEQTQKFFQEDARLQSIYVFRQRSQGHYSIASKLVKEEANSLANNMIMNNFEDYIDAALGNKVVFDVLDRSSSTFVVGMRFFDEVTGRNGFLLSVQSLERLSNLFNNTRAYNIVLTKKDFTRILDSAIFDVGLVPYQGVLKSTSLPTGTFEVLGEDKRQYVVSYSRVGVGNLSVLAVIDKENALKALEILIIKSFLIFIALISIAVILSILFSRYLVSALKELVQATRKISKGDFKVDIKVKSGDEIGVLAQSFNEMAVEVNRLLQDNIHKARMEKELETAKAVQETLFPESHFQFGDFKLQGFYSPASECGGDWWFYHKQDDKLFICIGDATGHGAPAALVTSAARSAFSIISTLPDVTPKIALRLLNKSIHETAKGRILMTLFLAMVDLKTGKVVYSNASHDPPYLVPKKENLNINDFVPLNQVNNPRLGHVADHEFSEYEFKLEDGDLFLLYTDGVFDFRNPHGDMWGESRFLRTAVKILADDHDAKKFIGQLMHEIDDFRESTELPDDMTVVACNWRDAA